MNQKYEPLSIETLPTRLEHVDSITGKIGNDTSSWHCTEVGDGNLNYVFIVTGPKGSVIVKQALPYVRVVGDAWPLSLKRAFFECEALKRQHTHCPDLVPEVYYFDSTHAIIVMQYLIPHTSLRNSLKHGIQHPNLATDLGTFCANMVFKGSDLHMDTAKRKQDLAIFADNVDLCNITEDLVFTDPYYMANSNNFDMDILGDTVKNIHANTALKIEVQKMMFAFTSRAETLCHGDLHTGSVMVTDMDTKIIDPEFAVYAPMGFDVGMLIANFFMAYYAQSGHATDTDSRHTYSTWILDTVKTIITTFEKEFSHLWHTQRHGILYPKSLFEDQGHMDASYTALHHMLQHIWQDALGFAGIEMIRRTYGLAHIMEVDSIVDKTMRTQCQKCILQCAENLILNRHTHSLDSVLQHIVQIQKG